MTKLLSRFFRNSNVTDRLLAVITGATLTFAPISVAYAQEDTDADLTSTTTVIVSGDAVSVNEEDPPPSIESIASSTDLVEVEPAAGSIETTPTSPTDSSEEEAEAQEIDDTTPQDTATLIAPTIAASKIETNILSIRHIGLVKAPSPAAFKRLVNKRSPPPKPIPLASIQPPPLITELDLEVPVVATSTAEASTTEQVQLPIEKNDTSSATSSGTGITPFSVASSSQEDASIATSTALDVVPPKAALDHEKEASTTPDEPPTIPRDGSEASTTLQDFTQALPPHPSDIDGSNTPIVQ